jgi:hypothetical protein
MAVTRTALMAIGALSAGRIEICISVEPSPDAPKARVAGEGWEFTGGAT